MISLPESAFKARYCAQMLAATAVLASLAPDDFHRRVLARPAFVYTHEFIRWARRSKNEAKRQKATRAAVRELEHRLGRLEDHDYAPYEEIRHRISAHRQPFGTDVAENMVATSTAWTDVSDAAVRVLAEDAREIWNLLAAAFRLPRLEHFPPVTDELRKAIADDAIGSAPDGLRLGVGSFDRTRPDAIPLHQGGELGERIREIVDAVRNTQLLSRLWPLVDGHDPYWRVVVSATITEANALVDLVYAQPDNTKPQNRHTPLLELLERDDRGSEAIAHLRAGLAALDRDALKYVRRMRGTIGAHIDNRRSVSALMRDLETVDADALNTVLDNLFKTLSKAASVDLFLRLILMPNRSIPELSRLDVPEEAKPYE